MIFSPYYHQLLSLIGLSLSSLPDVWPPPDPEDKEELHTVVLVKRAENQEAKCRMPGKVRMFLKLNNR